MEQNQTQPTNQLLNTQPASQMAPDQAAASLAFATNLQSQLLQHQTPQAPASPETAPGQEKPPEQDSQKEIDALRSEFDKKIADMKKGITDEIKADIKDALANEQDN